MIFEHLAMLYFWDGPARSYEFDRVRPRANASVRTLLKTSFITCSVFAVFVMLLRRSNYSALSRRDAERNTITLKPRPHQQQRRSNIIEWCKSKDSFDEVECCLDIVAIFGNNVERNFVISTNSKQIDHVQLVSILLKGTKFHDKLVRHCCRFFWQQSRTLLRHCCRCGRGFTQQRGNSLRCQARSCKLMVLCAHKLHDMNQDDRRHGWRRLSNETIANHGPRSGWVTVI